MSLEEAAKYPVGSNETRINRRLVLCAAPIFACWTGMAAELSLAGLIAPRHRPLLGYVLVVLYLFSPLCVSLGWMLLAKSALCFQDPQLKLGRRLLIMASFLSLPIVIITILALIPLFIKAVSDGSVFN
jgi:hypothetical protein